ncbi:MAG: antitoxin [Clostridia bacterium]|nr:antitoxin [Clostridia bacterium]
MGKTSSAVKNRYNEKAYDRIAIVVPKGQKQIIKNFADANGMSVNAFIQQAIADAMNKKQ